MSSAAVVVVVVVTLPLGEGEDEEVEEQALFFFFKEDLEGEKADATTAVALLSFACLTLWRIELIVKVSCQD